MFFLVPPALSSTSEEIVPRDALGKDKLLCKKLSLTNSSCIYIRQITRAHATTNTFHLGDTLSSVRKYTISSFTLAFANFDRGK